jgi:hypothetical protein
MRPCSAGESRVLYGGGRSRQRGGPTLGGTPRVGWFQVPRVHVGFFQRVLPQDAYFRSATRPRPAREGFRFDVTRLAARAAHRVTGNRVGHRREAIERTLAGQYEVLGASAKRCG